MGLVGIKSELKLCMKKGHSLQKFDIQAGADGTRWKSLELTKCGTWAQFMPDEGDALKGAAVLLTRHTPQPFKPPRPASADRYA